MKKCRLTCYIVVFFLGAWSRFIAVPTFAAETGPAVTNSTGTGTRDDRQCASATPEKLLSRSFSFSDPTAKDFPVEFSLQTFRPEEYTSQKSASSQAVPFSSQLRRAPETGPIVLKIFRSRPVTIDNWLNSYVSGIATIDRSDNPDKPERIVPVGMSMREKTEEYIALDAFMPDNPSKFSDEKWVVIPILCGGAENKILGFASTRVTSISVLRAWTYSAIFIAAFWLLISLASWQINRKKLQKLWMSETNSWRLLYPNSNTQRYIWKGLKVCDPVFIAQDSLGYGSLARFQILIFTTVVGFVLIYILIHSGVVSSLSYTILSLLGVTVAGGTIARYAGDWAGISPESRRWLLGSGIIAPGQDKPRWSDLLETQGEIDVAKVQALLFTIVISMSIFASGYIGLSSFTLPDQIVYLSIVSQGAYVFGKFLPADTRKRVEEDLSNLRKSAENLKLHPTKPEYKTAYKQAVESAEMTLDQTYGEKFKIEEFRKST